MRPRFKKLLLPLATVGLFSITCFGQNEPDLINPLFGYNTIRDIAFVDEQHGYTIGFAASYRTIDGGENWIEMLGISEVEKLELSDQIYAMMSDEALIISTNGGLTWNEIFTSESFSDLIDVSITPGEVIFLATETSLLKSSDEGQNWIEMEIPLPMVSIHFFNTVFGVAITNDGQIRRTSDGGESWSIVYEIDTSSDAVGDLEFPDSQVGYAYSWNGNLLKTENGGNSWFELTAPDREYRSITFYNQDLGIIGADSGSIIRTVDGGENWEVVDLVENEFSSYVNNVGFRNEQECIAAGPGSNFYRSNDGGSSWSAGSCVFGQIMALDIYNEDSLYILGEDDLALLHSNGGYCNILTEVDNFFNDGRDIEMISESLGYAVTSDTLKRTEDGGLTWENVIIDDIGTCSSGQDLTYANGKLYFSTGCVPRFFVSEDLGFTWTAPADFAPRGDIYVLDDQLIFLIGNSINKSTDGGLSWDFISVPETPLNSAFFVNEQIGYAGLYRDLYKTVDGGESWTLIPEPDDGFFTQYRDIAFINEDIGWVTDVSNFHETLDGGMTWTTYSGGLSSIKEVEVNGTSLYAFGTHTSIFRKQFAGPLSFSEPSFHQDRSLLIFPNPIKDQFNVKLPEGANAQNCSFISLDGRVSALLKLGAKCNECSIEVPEYIAPGLYLIQIRTADSRVLSGRVVIQ